MPDEPPRSTHLPACSFWLCAWGLGCFALPLWLDPLDTSASPTSSAAQGGLWSQELGHSPLWTRSQHNSPSDREGPLGIGHSHILRSLSWPPHTHRSMVASTPRTSHGQSNLGLVTRSPHLPWSIQEHPTTILTQGQKFQGISTLAGRGPAGWEGSALSSGKLPEVVRRGQWLSHKFIDAAHVLRPLFCAGRIPDAGWGFTVLFLTHLAPHFPAKTPWGWVRWGEDRIWGIPLVVQWLELCTFHHWGHGFNP